jgi:lysozyme family protein
MKFIEFLKSIFRKKLKPSPQAEQQIEPAISEDRQNFEKAMEFIRIIEGGIFDHPDDPGGYTNMGLTQRDYPNLDLKNLTRKEADDIFYKDYWKKSVASMLPYPVYIPYFDSVVNTGVGRANKILQSAVKVKQDGFIGPITLKAVNTHKDLKQLALLVADKKQSFYESLVKKKSKFKSFIRGWTRRTKSLKKYIETGKVIW